MAGELEGAVEALGACAAVQAARTIRPRAEDT
jgi:hypothetical protein